MAKLEQLHAEADRDVLEVPIGGKLVRIKETKRWPASAVRAVREGDFDTWAEKCLVDGDYKIWQSVDPVLEEVEEFFDAVNEATGSSPKGSRTSRR